MIGSVEARKERIIRLNEKSLRLNRFYIWGFQGDNNTNFFPRYADQRRNMNTISKLKSEMGNILLFKKIWTRTPWAILRNFIRRKIEIY